MTVLTVGRSRRRPGRPGRPTLCRQLGRRFRLPQRADVGLIITTIAIVAYNAKTLPVDQVAILKKDVDGASGGTMGG